MKPMKGHYMKFVKFTKKADGTPIWINPEKVVAFNSLPDGGTRLVFDEVFAYQVSEEVVDVLGRLMGCRAK